MKLCRSSTALAGAFFLLSLPHCMVNGKAVDLKTFSSSSSSSTTVSSVSASPEGKRSQSTRSQVTSTTTSTSSGNTNTSPYANLPDPSGMPLYSNGLPYFNQTQATAFFAAIKPSFLSHVTETSKAVWQEAITSDDNCHVRRSFEQEARDPFLHQVYMSPLPNPDADHLRLDADHLVTGRNRVVTKERQTLKKGTPGVVYEIGGNYSTDTYRVTLFASLDGAVYALYEELPVSFAPGAGPISDWPTEVQNPYGPSALTGLSNPKYKEAYDDVFGAYNTCFDNVRSEFQPLFDANDAADIHPQTRKNREEQIGRKQEQAIKTRCEKLKQQAYDNQLRISKEAALDQLTFRKSLYAANRERFGKK